MHTYLSTYIHLKIFYFDDESRGVDHDVPRFQKFTYMKNQAIEDCLVQIEVFIYLPK